MDPKKLARLEASIADRVSIDQSYDRRGSDPIKKMKKRQGMDAVARRDYVDSLRPGNSRWWIMEEALTRTTRSERVAFIAELMTDGLYRTALVRPLAAAWGMGLDGTNHLVAEASRWVRGAIGDREEVRAKCLAFLEVVAHDALENGDRRSAVAAVRTVADIAGLISSKTEISGPNGGPIPIQDLAKLSDSELEEAIVKAAANAIRSSGGPKDEASQAVLDAEKRLLDAALEQPEMSYRRYSDRG